MKKIFLKSIAFLIIVATLLSLSSCGLALSILLGDNSDIGKIEKRMNEAGVLSTNRSITLTIPHESGVTVTSESFVSEDGYIYSKEKSVAFALVPYYQSGTLYWARDKEESLGSAHLIYSEGIAYVGFEDGSRSNLIKCAATRDEISEALGVGGGKSLSELFRSAALGVQPTYDEEKEQYKLKLTEIDSGVLFETLGGSFMDYGSELSELTATLTYDKEYFLSRIGFSFKLSVPTANNGGKPTVLNGSASIIFTELKGDISDRIFIRNESKYTEVDNLLPVIKASNELSGLINSDYKKLNIETETDIMAPTYTKSIHGTETVEFGDGFGGFYFNIDTDAEEGRFSEHYSNGIYTGTDGVAEITTATAKAVVASRIADLHFSYAYVKSIKDLGGGSYEIESIVPAELIFDRPDDDATVKHILTLNDDGSIRSIEARILVRAFPGGRKVEYDIKSLLTIEK